MQDEKIKIYPVKVFAKNGKLKKVIPSKTLIKSFEKRLKEKFKFSPDDPRFKNRRVTEYRNKYNQS